MQKKTSAEGKPATSNLDSHYRPLGLKAVLAAALMLKRKPAKQMA